MGAQGGGACCLFPRVRALIVRVPGCRFPRCSLWSRLLSGRIMGTVASKTAVWLSVDKAVSCPDRCQWERIEEQTAWTYRYPCNCFTGCFTELPHRLSSD